MQRQRLAVAPGVPAFLVTRPAYGSQAIDRPRLWSAITALVDERRVCLVSAPAGYGKTQTLSGWAEHSGRKVAWLSLTAADRRPAGWRWR